MKNMRIVALNIIMISPWKSAYMFNSHGNCRLIVDERESMSTSYVNPHSIIFQ